MREFTGPAILLADASAPAFQPGVTAGRDVSSAAELGWILLLVAGRARDHTSSVGRQHAEASGRTQALVGATRTE